MELVPSSALIVESHLEESDTDVSEFPEISSLTSGQQAMSLSVQQHMKTTSEQAMQVKLHILLSFLIVECEVTLIVVYLFSCGIFRLVN